MFAFPALASHPGISLLRLTEESTTDGAGGVGLKQQKLFSPNCGDWKFEVKVSAGLASPGASLLSFELMSSPGVFPQSVSVS